MAGRNVVRRWWYRSWRGVVLGVGTLASLAPKPTVAQLPRVAGVERHVARRVTVDAREATLVTVLRDIAKQAGLSPVYNESVIPAHTRITVRLRDVLATDALSAVLRGTGLVAVVQQTGYLVIGPAEAAAVGTIVGTVIDAATKKTVSGATVSLDEATRGVVTDEKGSFRITGVADGTHRLRVRRVGYARSAQEVTVTDGAIQTVTIALTAAVSTLDQVVVTGTVVATELRAVPNAITVITAKQLEERGITKLDQLFRGDVPGLFAQNIGSAAALDEVTMFSRGVTALGAFSGDINITNPIKTYVDGVELADSKYLSQIDPRSIERIEILTGPQASTIYGSNAMNGVMQVFTKRGSASHPQLTLSLLSGLVENDFSKARTPQHDYVAQVNGIEGRMSYNVGGSWNYIGP
jgi:hypothetical protein